jgi:hypothetical protein
MQSHFLLKTAFKYAEPTKDKKPAGCFYDEINGYWTIGETGAAMVSCASIIEGLMTKKADFETGEDQKGQ